MEQIVPLRCYHEGNLLGLVFQPLVYQEVFYIRSYLQISSFSCAHPSHTLLFCGPDGVMWPTAVRVQAANIKDAHVFDNDLVPHLSSTTKVLLGDGGYDQQSCYDACDAREVTLLAPIEVKKTALLKDANALCSTRTPKSARSSRYARQPSSRSKVISSVFSISNVSPVKDWLTSERSAPSRFSPMFC